MSEPAVEVALDNDVIFKAVCFGLDTELWGDRQPGVLGAARFVLDAAVDRSEVARDETAVRAALVAFFANVAVLEPSEEEVALAAELELEAREQTLPLDTGEAQLTAIVLTRALAALETGDKRAIMALEGLLVAGAAIEYLAGRVWCLEQLIRRLLVDEGAVERVRTGICAEPRLDKALAICFACASAGSLDLVAVTAALDSYINDLSRAAPTVLAA